MNAPRGPAAPASGSSDDPEIPASAPSVSQTEIEALLGFEPVPRKRDVEGGWTAELQREFITRLAAHGSATKACDEMGKDQTGVMKLYRSPLGASFRAAWDGAVALAKQRRALLSSTAMVSPGARPPTLDHRRKYPAAPAGPQPGQMLNEFGDWEDEDSIRRRAEEAKDSISAKLLRARRLYLQEISDCPGKRAAFEMLTELPIDWEKAERLEPQADEPFRKPNMRKPDMLLTAENGWMGETAHGPDKKAELRQAMDAYRAEMGLPPIDWDE
jgi:hypothetical protein